jgi:hypothetical protein
MAALDSVSVTNFQTLAFDVETPSQETALQLFTALCEQHNSRDGDEKSQNQFCRAARNWLILSVEYKFRQLTEAIVRIPGMEQLSFQDAMAKAAVVGWDDFFQEWLKREKNLLRDDVDRYLFAKCLGRCLHFNLSLSSFEVLEEIRTNSVGLRRCDRYLAGNLTRIVKDIQIMAGDQSADIRSYVRALNDVRLILPSRNIKNNSLLGPQSRA